MATTTSTIAPPATPETQAQEQSVTASTENLLYPEGFTFFHNRIFHRFQSYEEERKFRKLHHAAALRWLGSQGYGNEGAGGHMTVRDPEFHDHFWINPFAKSFSHLTPDDLVLLNDKGVVVGGNMHQVNPAGYYIHSAIHRARPDVHAVVHMHTIAGKAFSAFGKELEMWNQDCCQFFEAHTVFPAFDGFVLAADEGEAIAKALGPTNKAIILQNHGLLVVGRSPDGAAFTFGALERCIEAQFKTESLAQLSGFKPVKVTPEMARGVKQYYVDEFQYLTFQPA
ncbi:arad-like aldolase/epimerase [Thozetella sp. PMI_491]|nr:arad-like aldolase/epimerase [Thozetella sp. PMI_491]